MNPRAMQNTQDRVESLEKEKQLFFDTAYRTYTTLAGIAEECKDRDAARRISDAISDLGMLIGRTDKRERPR